MDLELLKEAASEQPLVLELLHEGAFHVDSLHVLYQADLLARVDLFIELKQFVDNLLENGLLGLFFGVSGSFLF